MPASSPANPAFRVVRKLTNARCFWLLVLLAAFILIIPWLPASIPGLWERAFMMASILVTTVHAGRGGRRQLLFSFVLAGAWMASIILEIGFPNFLHPLIMPILGLANLMYVTFTILIFVLDTGTVTVDHIYGAICAYVLIAMIFAGLYGTLELTYPGSFAGVKAGMVGDRPWYQFLYFSFTTLSTVGYGDISPVSSPARSFCICQQLVGTFYVAILIARLAGLYPPHEPEANQENPS